MLLLATILTFTACGNDDIEPPVYHNGKLIGTWVHTSSTYNENLGMEVSIESIWVFNPNEKFTWTVLYKMNNTILRNNETSGKFSYDGKVLILTTNDEISKITAEVQGSTLTITTESGSMIHYKR